MKQKFEMGSKEFMIPEEVDEHLTEEEFEDYQEMYSANDYDADREVSPEARKKIDAFKAKQKKIGSGVFGFLSRAA